MRTLLALGCLLAALPTSAADAPGLDLSAPPKPPAKESGDSVELPPIDLSKPGEPASPAPREEEKPHAGAPFSEKDVALGDKVKAVQRKGFIKRGRFEVAPIFALTVNDSFYQKFGSGLRVAYNLQDTFALALRYVTYGEPEFGNPHHWQPAPIRTDNAREGKIAFGGQLLASQIYDQLMLDGIWSPIYGKVAFLDRQIVHFDLYLAAGFGLVWTATSYSPRDNAGLGPSPDRFLIGRSKLGVDLGGGVRFYPKEWMAFELGMFATLYPDQPQPSLPATIQKVFVANVGVSFFFPTTFDYVHP